jgi:adenylate cyclase
VRLDDTDPAAWNWRGMALVDLGRWDAALDANSLAIKLDPYESRWRVFRATIMVQAAHPAEALTVIDQTLALDPPNVGSLMATACEAYMLAGQAERAITTCEKASALTSGFSIPMILAAAYANQGDMAKAAAAKAQALRIVPNLTIALAKQFSNNREYVRLAESNLYGGLRKAGFPEK